MRKILTVCLFSLTLATLAHSQEKPALAIGQDETLDNYLATLAHSEEEPAPKPVDLESMTIEEAVELAQGNSVEIRKTAISIRDNQTRLSEETLWSWLRPNLSLRGGFDIDTGEPRLGLGVGIDLKDVMGAGNKRIRTIKFSIDEERKNLKALKASVRIKVKAFYREYMVAREKVKTLEEALRNDETLLKTAETTGSNIEKLLARSMVNQDRVALITAGQELERAEMNLRELLGVKER